MRDIVIFLSLFEIASPLTLCASEPFIHGDKASQFATGSSAFAAYFRTPLHVFITDKLKRA